MYNEYKKYFNNHTIELYNQVKNIKSSYKIKPYFHQEFINLFNTINLDYNINHKTLQQTESIIPLVQTKTAIKDIIELEDYMASSKKSIDSIIDCSKYYKIGDKIKKDILQTIYKNSFISIEIIKWIEESCSNYYLISWNNIKIHLINDQEISKELIDHIVTITKWLLLIKSTSPTFKLEIYIFLSDEKKKTPSKCSKKTCPLNRSHINSGVSWHTKWIQIYRKEELLKVLIHELIHYLNLDIQEYSDQLDEQCSHIKMHKESIEILVNESYTELLAIYLHTLYIAKYISNISREINIKEIFWELYMNEEKFIIYQINKIFNNYKIPDITFFQSSNDFIQHTNVISYYIIKYLLFINTKYFISNYKSITIIFNIISYLLPNIFKLNIPNVIINNDLSLRMSLFQIN